MIELLVVIAIIGILASLLLPAMSRAKDKARIVACLSNLKQIGVIVHTYGIDNDEAFSIGYVGSDYQLNYTFSHPVNLKPGPFWPYYAGDYVGAPQLWYCPAVTTPWSSYNGAYNPWPPALGSFCRAGYSSRPELANGMEIKAGETFPRLMMVRDQVIISDFVTKPNALPRHTGSLNALYGDGTAKNVLGNAAINDYFSLLPSSFNASANVTVANIFKELDAAR